MYSFSYYAEERAPEAFVASDGPPTDSLLHTLEMGSPALSSSDDNVSTAGESGFGENDFLPYEFCPSMQGPLIEFDLYEQFDAGIGNLIQDITDVSSESPYADMFPISFVEIKTEVDEQPADVGPEAEDSGPTGEEFATFGDIKIEEEEQVSGSTITVPITFTGPTQDRKIKKASRKQSLKGNNPSAMHVRSTECPIETKTSAKFAVDENTGESETEKDGSKSVSRKRHYYEMSEEECNTRELWTRVRQNIL